MASYRIEYDCCTSELVFGAREYEVDTAPKNPIAMSLVRRAERGRFVNNQRWGMVAFVIAFHFNALRCRNILLKVRLPLQYPLRPSFTVGQPLCIRSALVIAPFRDHITLYCPVRMPTRNDNLEAHHSMGEVE
jgi:hypothetical protein